MVAAVQGVEGGWLWWREGGGWLWWREGGEWMAVVEGGWRVDGCGGGSVEGGWLW